MKHLAQKISFVIIFSIGFLISHAQCTVDCVWPGDSNNNGIANNVDFIFTGLVFGTGGPARSAAEQGSDWNPKTAPDWSGSFTTLGGLNHKHADTDGDGFVDGGDLYSPNYNATNDNFSGLMGNVITGDDLFLEFSDSIIEAGDTIIIDVHLGSEDNPIENIHGIAFSIEFDTSKIIESETVIDFHGGWLGTPFVDVFTLDKYDPVVNPVRADFAATRGDNGSVSGNGDILQILIVTEENLDGKKGGLINSIDFQFENILGIDSIGTDMLITAKADTVDVSDGIVGVFDRVEKETIDVLIFPNPVTTDFLITASSHGESIDVVNIYNSLGQKVYRQNVENNNLLVSTKDWKKGIYFIKIEDENGKVVNTQKVVVL
ncbi:MAG: T9SS type A sorting domain-containing protein [Chitinophagales bacterium]